MKLMTLERFLAILIELEPYMKYVPSTADLHSIAFLVVADRWIKNVPDNELSNELREELQYFISNNRFSWQ